MLRTDVRSLWVPASPRRRPPAAKAVGGPPGFSIWVKSIFPSCSASCAVHTRPFVSLSPPFLFFANISRARVRGYSIVDARRHVSSEFPVLAVLVFASSSPPKIGADAEDSGTNLAVLSSRPASVGKVMKMIPLNSTNLRSARRDWWT